MALLITILCPKALKLPYASRHYPLIYYYTLPLFILEPNFIPLWLALATSQYYYLVLLLFTILFTVAAIPMQPYYVLSLFYTRVALPEALPACFVLFCLILLLFVTICDSGGTFSFTKCCQNFYDLTRSLYIATRWQPLVLIINFVLILTPKWYYPVSPQWRYYYIYTCFSTLVVLSCIASVALFLYTYLT
jgi:hypothetical protein